MVHVISLQIKNLIVYDDLLECFYGILGHVALDRDPAPGYDTTDYINTDCQRQWAKCNR